MISLDAGSEGSSVLPERYPFLTPNGYRYVVPYTHVYSTSTKGRWVGMSLLEAFSREFAVVGDEVDDEDCIGGNFGPLVSASQPAVSTDYKSNSLVYATKMANGKLYLLGRESECARAGRIFRDVVKDLLVDAEPSPCTQDEWFGGIMKAAAAMDLEVAGVGGTQKGLAILRQVDGIRHVVKRREHHVCMSGDCNVSTTATCGAVGGGGSVGVQCIDIIALARERSREEEETQTAEVAAMCRGPPYFISVSKPSSVSIHPGGKFHDNTLVRIVEDALCGNSVDKKNGGGDAGGKKVNTSNKKQQSAVSTLPTATIAAPPREFVVVDGIANNTKSVASEGGEEMRATYICEPVCDDAHLGGEARRWFPVISMRHSQVTMVDRRWVLEHLGAGTVVRMGSSPHGDKVLGLRQGSAVQCPLVPQHAFKEGAGSSDAAAAVSAGASVRSGLRLHVVHRIDRCTSGIIVLAIDPNSAKIITRNFMDKSSGGGDEEAEGGSSIERILASNDTSLLSTINHKQYLARVHGDIRQLYAMASSPEGNVSTCSIIGAANGSDSSDAPLPLLLVNSASYCASFQSATYWCLGRAEQAIFDVQSKEVTLRLRREEAAADAATEKELQEHGVLLGDKRGRADGEDGPASNNLTLVINGKVRTYATIEEKRDAMRQSVISKRRIEGPAGGDGGAGVGGADIKGELDHYNRDGEGCRQNGGEGLLVDRYAGLKYARTIVRFLSYDEGSKSSLVRCYPLTGRTHQIRIHLASNGFPIVGDTKYYEKGLGMGVGGGGASTADSAARGGACTVGGGVSGVGEDAAAICLHAVEYTVPMGAQQEVTHHCLRTAYPLWAE